MRNNIYKFTHYLILALFVCMQALIYVPHSAWAQNFDNVGLPQAGEMLLLSVEYEPALLKGIEFYPQNPLKFNFFVDPGEDDVSQEALHDESIKLIKYFLTSLTVPENELWVNLSPHEKERIIPENFSLTRMGRDLLAQDYMLKQLTASLLNPDEPIGEEFWSRLQAEHGELKGIKNISMNTFNKVWIVPDDAFIFAKGNAAYVVRNHLKVMMEEDYVAMQEANSVQGLAHRETLTPNGSSLNAQLIREILLPAIEKEVNSGKTFAPLRQVYNSMLLATWYKRNLKETLLGQVYSDQNKVKGINSQSPQVKQKIYDQYVEAFKIGVFDVIREQYDPVKKDLVARRYVSGGTTGYQQMKKIAQTDDFAVLTSDEKKGVQQDLTKFEVDLLEANDSNLEALDFAMITRKEEKSKNLLNVPGRKNPQMTGLIDEINQLYDHGQYDKEKYEKILGLFNDVLKFAPNKSDRRKIILRSRRQLNAKIKFAQDQEASLEKAIESQKPLIVFVGRRSQEVKDLLFQINALNDEEKYDEAMRLLLQLSKKVEGTKDRSVRVNQAIDTLDQKISEAQPSVPLIVFSGKTSPRVKDLLSAINASVRNNKLTEAQALLQELAGLVEGTKNRALRVEEAITVINNEIQAAQQEPKASRDVPIIQFRGRQSEGMKALIATINQLHQNKQFVEAREKLLDLKWLVKGQKERTQRVEEALNQLPDTGVIESPEEGERFIVFSGRTSQEMKDALIQINRLVDRLDYEKALFALDALAAKVKGQKERSRRVQDAIERIQARIEKTTPPKDFDIAPAEQEPESTPERVYALPSWGRKGVTLKVREVRNEIMAAAAKNDLIKVYLLLNDLLEQPDITDEIQQKARKEIGVINMLIEGSIMEIQQNESPLLNSLSHRGFRAFESWYLTDAASQSLLKNDELVVSAFERLAQETFSETAKQLMIADKASELYLIGPMRFLSSGNFEPINIILTNELFGAMDSADIDDFINLYSAQLNTTVSIVNPGAEVIPAEEKNRFKLRIVNEQGEKKTFLVNIAVRSSEDEVIDDIQSELDQLDFLAGDERARVYMSAEYYLSRNQNVYRQMRDMYFSENTKNFLDDANRKKREERVLKRIQTKDRASREMIAQRLQQSAKPFNPEVWPSQTPFSEPLSEHILQILDQQQIDFLGKNAVVPVLQRLLKSGRILYSDNLPETFLGYQDRETQKVFVFVDQTLQPFLESIASVNFSDLDQTQMAILHFLTAKLLNKSSKLILNNDPLVDLRLTKKDEAVINISMLGYMTELRYLSAIPGFLKAFQMNIRVEPPLLLLYKQFLPSIDSVPQDLKDLNNLEDSVEVLRPFLQSIGYASNQVALDYVIQLQEYLAKAEPLNIQNQEAVAKALSYGYERTGDGFGWVMRDLNREELKFRNFLADTLGRYHDEKRASLMANSLLRMKGDSLLILRKHGILTESDYQAIAYLDLDRLDPEIGERFFYFLDKLEEKFSMKFVQKNMESHLLPLEEIERLRNKYIIKDNEISIIETALNYQNVEAWIQRSRTAQQERGRLDPKHLMTHDLQKPLLNPEERADLFRQMQIILKVLRQKTYPEAKEQLSFSRIRKGYKFHAIKVLFQHNVKVNDVILEHKTQNYFRVDQVLNDQLRLVNIRQGEPVPDLSPEGMIDVIEKKDASSEIEYKAFKKIYDAYEKGDLSRIPNFSRFFGLVPMRGPGGQKNVQFIDQDIPFRKISSFESQGDEEQAKAVELALNETPLTIVEGFAGSGKGKVIKEIIRQEVRNGKKIIFTSKNHQAVDNTVRDIMEDEPVLRVGNDPAKFKYGTEAVWPGTFKGDENKRLNVLNRFFEKRQKYSRGGQVIAGTAASLAVSEYVKKVEYQADVIIIDEASALTLSEMLIAIQYLKPGGKFIVLGHTFQLPPGALQFETGEAARGLSLEEKELYGKSALQWLIDQGRGDYIYLSTDYRHHSLIASFLSKIFFDGDIKVNKWEPFDGYTLKLVDIAEDVEFPQQTFERTKGTSFYNPHSIQKGLERMQTLTREKGVRPEDQLYIASYASQNQMMENALANAYSDKSKKPQTSTVDAIQGGQKHSVHFDLVRSNSRNQVGFTLNENRMYVGLSRAEQSLTLYFDSRTYKKSDLMEKIQNFYKDEVKAFLPENEDFAMAVSHQTKIPSTVLNADAVGGINLDPAMLNLQVLRDDSGIPLPVYDQPLENLNIEGFVPIIINITPIAPLPFISSQSRPSKDESVALTSYLK